MKCFELFSFSDDCPNEFKSLLSKEKLNDSSLNCIHEKNQNENKFEDDNFHQF